MILRVIDIETTGMEPPAEVIEVGWQHVALTGAVGVLIEGDDEIARGCAIFGAERGIPPEASAVHHFTDRDLAGIPPCSIEHLREFAGNADALVAHNAAFEGQWFTPEILGDVPLVCTYKAALRVWPDAPAHSNQVLRYWLGLDLPEHRAMPPHRALPDAFVTASILVELLKHATLADLIAWSGEPRLMPKVTFGKHRGAKWTDVPRDYLDWLVFKSDLDADTKWNARRELEARRK